MLGIGWVEEEEEDVPEAQNRSRMTTFSPSRSSSLGTCWLFFWDRWVGGWVEEGKRVCMGLVVWAHGWVEEGNGGLKGLYGHMGGWVGGKGNVHVGVLGGEPAGADHTLVPAGVNALFFSSFSSPSSSSSSFSSPSPSPSSSSSSSFSSPSSSLFSLLAELLHCPVFGRCVVGGWVGGWEG